MNQTNDSFFDLNSDLLVELIDELPLWSAPFGLKLLESVKIKKNITALDIGFGAGFPLTELAMRLGNSCKVYGIDPWEAATRRTRKKLEFYGINNVELITGVAEDIPIKDASVDLITSNNGINNVSDIGKTLEECSRVLKQGGQFVLTMNLNTSMIEFYEIMEVVLKELELPEAVDAMHLHIYSKRRPLDEVNELLKSSGFEVKNIIHDKFEYSFSDGTAMLQHYFIRLAFLDSWRAIVPEEVRSEAFCRIEKIFNEIANRDGVFNLTVPFVVIDCIKR